MTNFRRWHVVAAALAVAVFLLPACSGKGDKTEDEKKDADKKRDPGGNQTEDLGEVKPDFSLTAKVLCEEHEKTPQKAFNTKYEGKVLEVTGLVKGVGRNTS